MSAPRTLLGFVEVLDTMVEWYERSAEPSEVVRRALDAVRVAASVPTAATCAALEAPMVAAADPRADGARGELLCALVLVATTVVREAAVGATPEHYAGAERVLLTHAANLGKLLGVKDAGKEARLALDRGRAEGRRADRFPEPGFARELARGALLAQYRDFGRLSQDDLVRLATSRGMKVTKALVARIEGGTAAKTAPVDALFACFELSPDETRRRAEVTHDLAREMACRVAGSDVSDRWFAEFVALFGEAKARAVVTVAACGAARIAAEKLRVR